MILIKLHIIILFLSYNHFLFTYCVLKYEILGNIKNDQRYFTLNIHDIQQIGGWMWPFFKNLGVPGFIREFQGSQIQFDLFLVDCNGNITV